MASRIRSILASRVFDVVSSVPSAAKTSSKSIENLLKLHVRGSLASPHQSTQGHGASFSFALSLNRLLQAKDRSSVESFGSALVQGIDTDGQVLSAHLDDTDPRNLSVIFRVPASEAISSCLSSVSQHPHSFWMQDSMVSHLPKQKVVFEFSSPNIAKPFHVGHLRSTLIGHCLSQLHSALGFKVTRLNFLGDWGTQFGLLKHGCDVKQTTADDLKEDPIRKLYDIYVWVNRAAEKDPSILEAAKKIFAGMEAGEKEHLADWKFFRDITIKELEKTYARLGVSFNEYHGESSYSATRCAEVLRAMQSRNLIEDHPDGRKLFEYAPGKKVTLLKSDGAAIYLTRDIAAAVDRFARYSFDRHYYVVDSSQGDHFKALFSSLSGLGYEWADRMQHIRFGRIMGMSSRKGEGLFLSDVLDEGRSQMSVHQTMRETTRVEGEEAEKAADTVALSALLVYDLKRPRARNYNFNWKDALHYKGNTGVKLQYSHCRLMSLEQNCGVKAVPNADLSALMTEPSAVTLAAAIARFDEVLFLCMQELEPSILANYLFQLCDAISIALRYLPVKGAPDESTAQARLLLFVSARHALRAGLEVLGVRALERM